jgi:hypothetical protein
MSTPNYSFPGVWSFISRAADNRIVHHLGRARSTWHVSEIHYTLSQIPKRDYAEQRELIGHALKVRESLAVTLRGIDEAISEVAETFDLFDKG